jgi:hypothetical protein
MRLVWQIMSRQSEFICVEIDIKTDHDCDAFVEWFQAQDNYVNKLACETHRWHVYFDPLHYSSADLTIQKLCELLLQLPPQVKKQWEEAGVREFCVGYEIGDEPRDFGDHFSPKTLSMAAQVGAGIGIVLYPPAMFVKRENQPSTSPEPAA